MNELHAVTLPASKHGAQTLSNESERWLFVDGASAFGGHEVMLLRWLEELASQHAVSPCLLARPGSTLQREGERYATVFNLPPVATGKVRRLLGALRDIAAFLRVTSDVRPHVCIVAEGCLLSQPLFAPVARLIGLRVLVYVPMVQTSVSMGFANGRQRDAIVRHAYARIPHGWITITHEQAVDFRAWTHVRRPILILQNTVAHAIEAAGVVRNERAPHDERLRVAILGRLEAHQKGLDLLLDHAAAHPEIGDEIELTLVGEGPYAATATERLRADDRLRRWLSIQPWSPMLDVMRRSDVVLMTSRYEGVPLVMLEAMALGVPVVAPDLPGTRAFLSSDSLFPAGDMTRAFQTVTRLRDVNARMSIAQRNRAMFESQASNAAFAAAVRKLTAQIRTPGREQRSTA